MPASSCLCTTSATAPRTRLPKAAASTGTPSSLAYIMRIRSSGRGRLPVWVVRKRSVLRFMDSPELKLVRRGGLRWRPVGLRPLVELGHVLDGGLHAPDAVLA